MARLPLPLVCGLARYEIERRRAFTHGTVLENRIGASEQRESYVATVTS